MNYRGPGRRLEGWTVQHGGTPGWLEEIDPAGVILYVMDSPNRLPFPYCTGFPGAAQLRAVGISSCCYIINLHKTSVISKESMT